MIGTCFTTSFVISLGMLFLITLFKNVPLWSPAGWKLASKFSFQDRNTKWCLLSHYNPQESLLPAVPEWQVWVQQTSQSLSNECKCVLKEVKSLFADRMKQCIASHKFGSRDYWWLSKSMLNKIKSQVPPLSNFKYSHILQSALLGSSLSTPLSTHLYYPCQISSLEWRLYWVIYA